MRYRRAFAEADNQQAIIDALVAALEGMLDIKHGDEHEKARAALSMARKGG